jgi:16S rRNA (cytidine1402-2'-O)-methyltransferase
MPGTLFVVATPIGNLEDITLRALRVLRTASIIAAEDTRRTAILLQRYEISTPTLSLHEHNERQRTRALLDRLLVQNQSIAIVSDAGTPLISDPGMRLVRAAIEAGIRVEPIPGPSAVMAALTVAGVPADRFTFLGFPPSRTGERVRWFEALRDQPGTLVFFESPQRIRRGLETLAEILGDRHIVLTRELTKAHETVTRGWVSDVLSQPIDGRGEYTIVVSDQIRGGDDNKRQSDEEIVSSFCRMTENRAATPRDAVAAIVKTGPRRRQDVYAVLRRAGKLG